MDPRTPAVTSGARIAKEVHSAHTTGEGRGDPGMGRFDITPQVAEEWRGKYKASVEPHVDGEVLAVGAFRPAGAGTKMAISKLQVGALAYGAAHKLGKSKAGGLPGQFMLAVTPEKLYAFKYKPGRSGIKVKEESASWDRAGIKATADDRQTPARLPLQSADGEKIVCDQEGLGDSPWADDVIAELQSQG